MLVLQIAMISRPEYDMLPIYGSFALQARIPVGCTSRATKPTCAVNASRASNHSAELTMTEKAF